MNSSLQEALRKLHEAKQTEQAPQAKRAAVANETRQTSVEDQLGQLDDLEDFDITADMDMFDDLMAGTSDLAALEYNGAAAGPGSQPTQRNDTPIQSTSANSAIASTDRQQSQSTGTPSRDMVANTAKRTRTVTTTLVRENGRQSGAASSRRRQEIPGPAGVLGDAQNRAMELGNIGATQRPASLFKTPLSRTRTAQLHAAHSGDVDFEGGTWMAMLEHLDMAEYNPVVAKTVISTVAAAEWPVRKVLELSQSQKVRIMLIQLREISVADSDASAMVVDPTGEMKASIHHRVMKRFGEYLGAGTSVIVKDVVAMKLAGNRPFLVITEEMIDQIFTEKASGAPSNPIAVHDTQMTPAEAAQGLQPTEDATGTQEAIATQQSQRNNGTVPEETEDPFDEDLFAEDW
ncbi:hypothetical protein EV175_000202 [Coemansia sp. RSA 1933]|nr:hypothetical protein EV175_000202 [Coemansia sp. RSA 1933]